MHDALFATEVALTESVLMAAAAALGLQVSQLGAVKNRAAMAPALPLASQWRRQTGPASRLPAPSL